MKYIVVEMQTDAENSVATLVTQKETLPEAWSVYYMILGAAAISQIPYHSAVLMTNEGVMLASMGFDHSIPAVEE